MRVIVRRHGPLSFVSRRRFAIVGGAVSVGIFAWLFAGLADRVLSLFLDHMREHRLVPLVVTPVGFVAIVFLMRLAPDARGSGIPQAIAAKADPERATRNLISMWTGAIKTVLTLAGLAIGASIGREGPTVHVATAIMAAWHRIMRIPMKSSVIIAGGAAGVAAAFNTPLAGIAFAIEELAAAYEQRVTLLVMTAILISGMIALGLAGDYVYFGSTSASLSLGGAILVAPVVGVLGGLAGGCFTRIVLAALIGQHPRLQAIRRHPLVTAGVCGVVVAVLGTVTQSTWGTGYLTAREMINEGSVPGWFGLAKFVATAATAITGMPGGIFSPSLSVGAGFGNMIAPFFPAQARTAIVVLGMAAYFTGVVRAPLTAVFIITETTASPGLLFPLFATALIADQASQIVTKDRFYHALSASFSLDRCPTEPKSSSYPDAKSIGREIADGLWARLFRITPPEPVSEGDSAATSESRASTRELRRTPGTQRTSQLP